MAKNNLTTGEGIIVLIVGLTVGFAVVYAFWAAVIGFLAWAFNFPFEWSYPAGFAVLFYVARSLFKR